VIVRKLEIVKKLVELNSEGVGICLNEHLETVLHELRLRRGAREEPFHLSKSKRSRLHPGDTLRVVKPLEERIGFGHEVIQGLVSLLEILLDSRGDVSVDTDVRFRPVDVTTNRFIVHASTIAPATRTPRSKAIPHQLEDAANRTVRHLELLIPHPVEKNFEKELWKL